MRSIFTTILLGLSILGCGSDSTGEGDRSLSPAVIDVTGGRTLSDSGATETATQEPSEGDTDEATVDAGLHDEGSARPRGRVTTEPEVERPSFSKPGADQMISIPAGTLLIGSAPQDRLRVDFAENDLVPQEMTPFEIDALPYPGDPDRAYLTGVSRAEAEQLCAETGKRLCTELEWEWACKSTDARRYPFGNRYDEAAYPESELWLPASPFGVFAMGRILEWTGSPWGKDPDQVARGVARGFAEGLAETPERGRRCAKRWRRMPDGTHPLLGFRCCRGEIDKATYSIERFRPAHSQYKNMKPDKFAGVIRSIPELSAVHDNPHMFSDADIRAVLARRQSDREDLSRQGIHFRWKPMRWIPRQGTELWVAVGRSNRHSFIVALHEVEDNEKYVHASSLVLWNQPAPLALAYREGHRDELYWAPCWGCRDGGAIAFDDETNKVIITHKW
ncbi:MAG: SUMF1/EgtB/PvdO family nonheme iron enzyme [Deltaproteobacteria bacterium]|nr:SUMF1/EgtB/PvdO family nonheme iron enzyme [Deltaproteobacteria bacterium]